MAQLSPLKAAVARLIVASAQTHTRLSCAFGLKRRHALALILGVALVMVRGACFQMPEAWGRWDSVSDRAFSRAYAKGSGLPAGARALARMLRGISGQLKGETDPRLRLLRAAIQPGTLRTVLHGLAQHLGMPPEDIAEAAAEEGLANAQRAALRVWVELRRARNALQA